MKKDCTENIQKTYKKCASYGNCTEIVQKIYKKCTKFCNSSLVETGSLFELLQILAHFIYIFCTISVQFPYGAHFLYVFCMFSYVFCMFSVRSFFIGAVGSLSENDEYSYDEMERFWSNSRNIRQLIATESEPFSEEMLNPKSEIVLSKEMLDLMVKYYLASYENFDFQAPFDDGLEDSIVISRVIINKFGQCRIGSEVFGLTMSSRHVKSSFILVNFITRDDKVDCYAD